MAQIFHPSTNTLSKVSIFGAVFILGGVAWVWDAVNRSPYTTRQNVVRSQPVPFSHKHHVAGLGLDCRYCHSSVEESAFAGIPPTKTCMGCHSQVWTEAENLQPVRDSWRSGESIEWTRVYDLPDFVYFDHSIHIAKGVGCASCHGEVDEMPLMWQESPMTMGWCLSCHRDPEPQLRPREHVFDMQWERPATGADELGARLAAEYHVRSLTNCSICHR